jgi:hypothetical protein
VGTRPTPNPPGTTIFAVANATGLNPSASFPIDPPA